MLKFKKPVDNELGTHIVPLIDIIFVTLIFFLVLYRYSTFEVQNANVNTNKITNGNLAGSYDLENTVFIQVDSDGVIFINDVQVINTKEHLLEIIDDPSSKGVILMLDENASYASYGQLIRNLKSININKIILLE